MTYRSDKERYYMVQELCLRSTKFLHDVFRRRWKAETGTNWKDDDEHRKMFLYGPGRSIYDMLPCHQKPMICSTKVEEWDLFIMSFVLVEFQSSINYKNKNPAIDNLGTTGLFLADRHSQIVSKSEYDEQIEIITRSLKLLGMKDADVQVWIKEVESEEVSTAFKQMNVVFERGRDYEKQRCMDKASDCYSEAIYIPNLLPAHVALAYEKRARFCLRDNLKVDLALMNINESLSINNYSGSANYCAAECYRIKNHLSLAIYHYERAVVISSHLRNPDFTEYTNSALKRTFTDPLKPTLMPITAEEYKNIIQEENIYMDTITSRVVVPVSKPFIGTDVEDPGYEHAMEGFKYYYGWGVGQDFEKAVEHFRKSADCNNAGGTAALAKCYLNGHGVAKDSKEAYTVFKEATELHKKWPGLSTIVRGDHGVAEAQHALGRMHFDKHEFDLAADWYKRSMENGHGHSATIYGNMVTWGVAKEINIKLGKMCWKEGVNLKDPMALKWLLRYYLNELEPDLAHGYYMYGRAAKNPIILNWHEKPFNELITAIRKYRGTAEDELVRFERDYKLTLKGLTFMERLVRMEYYSDPNILRLENFILANRNFKKIIDPREAPQRLTEEMITEIKRRAQIGVKSAIQLAIVLKCANYIRKISEGMNELTENEMLEVLNLYYKISTIGRYWIAVLDLPEAKIKDSIQYLLKVHNGKNQEKGPIDEKLKLCASFLSSAGVPNKQDSVLLLLKEGVERYPDNIHYYIFISIYAKRCGDVQASRHWTEEGLKKDPNNVDLLYQLAVLIHEKPCLHLSKESEQYYRKLIAAASKDHPLVPYAWNSIANLHWHLFLAAKDNVRLKKKGADMIKECFANGAEAASHQLPCYLTNNKNSMSSRIRAALEKEEQDESKWRKEVVMALEKSKKLFERKYYLKSPTRQLLVRFHRRDFRKTVVMTSAEMSSLHETSVPSLMKQPELKNVSFLTPITLQEMNVVDSYCFENRKIDLTVLDDSFNSAISINCVVEDNNGDVIRLHIYDVDLTEESAKRFLTGTRLTVMNPCMIVENRRKHDWLRVDGLEYIKFLGTGKQMCGFCGEVNASHSCPSCSQLYCGNECLQLDVERHDHELICLLKPNPKKNGEE